MGDFTLHSNSTVNFNGSTNVNGNINAKSNIQNSGDLSVTGNYSNSWSSNQLTNSGTIDIDGDITNNGIITNDGIIVVSGDLTNAKNIEISNGSILYIKGNVDNTSNIVNNGNFYVDQTVTGNGDIDGSGTICNSDGTTDPTDGAKGNDVSCNVCDDGQPNTLPVQLISFTAHQTNSNITISWTTANEENNDYFEVLRSVDGMNFKIIAKVEGAGNSNITLDYGVTDNEIENNTYYYMLKQTDYDNKFTVSEMVVVNISNKLNTKVYPNPITQGEKLNIEFEGQNSNQLIIYDINGRTIKAVSTNSVNKAIDISEFAPGMYILKIQSGTQSKIEKLIVK